MSDEIKRGLFECELDAHIEESMQDPDYVAAFAELNLGFQKHVNVELTSCEVDPDILQIMFGGYGTDGVQHGLTVYAPIRRTFWQWLLRKPVQQRVTHFPNVKFLIEREDRTCGD